MANAVKYLDKAKDHLTHGGQKYARGSRGGIDAAREHYESGLKALRYFKDANAPLFGRNWSRKYQSDSQLEQIPQLEQLLLLRLAHCNRQQGHYRAAVSSYDAAIEVDPGPKFEKSARSAHVSAQLNRAICLEELNDLETALVGFESVIERLTREDLACNARYDGDRAIAQEHKLNVLRRLGRLESNPNSVMKAQGPAFTDFESDARNSEVDNSHLDAAQRGVTKNCGGSQEVALDNVARDESASKSEYARLQTEQGQKLHESGDYKAALERFDAALEIYGSPKIFYNQSDLDEHRATLLVNKARSLHELGDSAAILSYDAALQILAEPRWRGRPDLNQMRAQLEAERETVRQELSKHGQAASPNTASESKTVPAAQSDPVTQTEWAIDRAKLQRDRAIAFREQRNYTAAIRCHDAAQEIYAQPPLRDDCEVDIKRAELHHERAITLRQLGDPQAALASYDAALHLYARPHLKDNSDLDRERIRLHGNRAIACRLLESHEAELASYDAALELYARPHLKDNSDLDRERIRLHGNRAIACRQLENHEAELASYDAALHLYAQPPLKNNTAMDIEHAGLHHSRAIALRQLDDPQAALASYDAALALYARPNLKDNSDLDRERIRLHRNRAIACRQLENHEAELASYDAALQLYAQPPLKNNTAMDVEHAELHHSRAIALRQLDDPQAALASYDAAVALYDRPNLKDNTDLDIERAELQHHRAHTLRQLGDAKQALASYDAAVEVFERPHLKGNTALDVKRAKLHEDRGSTFEDLGDIGSALSCYDMALKTYTQSQQRDQHNLDINRIWIFERRGLLLFFMGKFREARESYDAALKLYAKPGLENREDLYQRRAETHKLHAITLSTVGDDQLAIEEFRVALDIYARPQFKENPNLDAKRANIYVLQAISFGNLEDTKAELDCYDAAIEIYMRPNLLDQPDCDPERASLFAKKSKYISVLAADDRLNFIDQASTFLADKVELPPLTELGFEDKQYAKYRECFLTFHTNWLAAAVENGWLASITRILGTIQGRDMASRILDELDDSRFDATNAPPSVQALRKTRLELRKIRARIDGIVIGSKGATVEGDKDSRSVMETQSDFLDSGPVDSNTFEEELAHLRTKYERIYSDFVPQLSAASKEKQYRLLARPYQKLHLDNIHSKVESDQHAILILMDLGEDKQARGARFHTMVLRRSQMQLVPLPDMHLVVSKLTGYSHAQRYFSTKMADSEDQRAAVHRYRDGPTNVRGISFGEVLPAFTVDSFRCFWDYDDQSGKAPELPLAKLLKSFFWRPLEAALSGVTHVTSIAHGSLHSVPLQCGMPKHFTLRNYPGLVFYADRKGLLGRNTQLANQKDARSFDAPIGVYGYTGYSNDIPNTRREISWVWQLYNDDRPLRPYPLYNHRPPSVRCLHLACHGAADARRDDQVLLVIGDETSKKATLDMKDVLDLPVRANVVYLGCCLAGQTVEDLEGEPTGLVSGFFLRGTRVLIGSVVLVDDAWGAVFGVLFQHHFLATSDPHKSLALAKSDIASGNWDPGEFGDDFVNHVEPLRSPDAPPTNRAPKPPQPILGDLLYGMRIFGE